MKCTCAHTHAIEKHLKGADRIFLHQWYWKAVFPFMQLISHF